MNEIKTINDNAQELGDVLTGKTIQGGHATVYFGKKFVYKITEKKVMEKSSRINAILASTNDSMLGSYVPKTVLFKDIGARCLVAEEMKTGHHPKKITGELLSSVNDVLKLVHKIDIEQVLTNFEGDSEPASDYWNIQLNQARKFESKLVSSLTLKDTDKILIDLCLDAIDKISARQHNPPRLVMIYKDVHPPNILVDSTEKLNAIIDWDSAMSGPVELEYAVLWHRYPELWPFIKPSTLDKDTFIVTGLVQGLRFWKSFTKDSKYSDMQREALRRTLDLCHLDDSNWLDRL